MSVKIDPFLERRERIDIFQVRVPASGLWENAMQVQLKYWFRKCAEARPESRSPRKNVRFLFNPPETGRYIARNVFRNARLVFHLKEIVIIGPGKQLLPR